MAEFNDQSSPFGRDAKFDLEALKVLAEKPEQIYALFMQLFEQQAKQLQSLESRVKQYVERYETNSRPPIRNITGGEGINVNLIEEQVTLTIDEDYVREVAGGGGGPTAPPNDTVPVCDGGDTTDVGALGEGAEAADEDTYLHDNDPETATGAVVYVQTRTYYDHAATPDPILYGYQRPLIFDRSGRLCQVGIEVRYTIDEPEDC